MGGHVAEEDAEGRGTLDAYEMALAANWTRRSRSAAPATLRRVGLINDDSTPVGQVHLGVVHLYDLERPAVSPREDALAEPEFIPIGDFRAEWDRFETWSQICIDALLR